MKNKWVKWVVGLTSVSAFAGLVGYMNEPQNMATEEMRGKEGLLTVSNLDWEEQRFDDPYFSEKRMVMGEHPAVAFHDTFIAEDSRQISRNTEVIKREMPRRTRTRSS